MKHVFAALLLSLSSSLFAITPQMAGNMQFKNDIPIAGCQEGQCIAAVWNEVCNQDNVVFDPNDDGSFDIVFRDFTAETNSDFERSVVNCHLQIPISVPDGYQLALKSVALGGVTEVAPNGASEASITHYFKSGRESVRTERFGPKNQLQDVVVNHTIDNDYTRCGQDREAVIGTKIEIKAQRGAHDRKNTFISIDEAAGKRKIVYRLDYKRCGGQEPQCGHDSILINGQCRPLGKQCSDYNFTDVDTCNNGKDTLQCDYIAASKSCVSKCPHGHFSMDGQCHKVGRQCSDYSGKGSKVCNNPNDDPQCDYNEGSKICSPDRR